MKKKQHLKQIKKINKSMAEYHLLKLKIQEHNKKYIFVRIHTYKQKDTHQTYYNCLSIGEEDNGSGNEGKGT